MSRGNRFRQLFYAIIYSFLAVFFLIGVIVTKLQLIPVLILFGVFLVSAIVAWYRYIT